MEPFCGESIVLAAVGGDVFDGSIAKLGPHLGAGCYVKSVECTQSKSRAMAAN